MDYQELVEELRYMGGDQYTNDLGIDAANTIAYLLEKTSHQEMELSRLKHELELKESQFTKLLGDLKLHRQYKCSCCLYEYRTDGPHCQGCGSSIANIGDCWVWRGMDAARKD